MKPVVIALAILSTILSSFAQSEKVTRSLPPAVRDALIEALAGEDGEYAARAKYTAVIQKFGPVQPYSFIRNSESSQILVLQTYLKKYGITAPADRYTGKATAPETMATAAADGVRLEEKMVEIYDRVLRATAGDTELTRIVQNLQRLTRDGHLAAFKSAVDHGGSLTKDQIRARVWQKYVSGAQN